MIAPEAEAILDFWFDPACEPRWFGPVDAAFDATVGMRFGSTHERAASGAFDGWEHAARGSLALVVLLDQFPRHMFRGTARAYATDARALAVARRALEQGFDRSLSIKERRFFYVPFEHSENLVDQDRSVALFRSIDDALGVDAAERHRATIKRFGRFPYRNAALGRVSTPEEERYLKEERWP